MFRRLQGWGRLQAWRLWVGCYFCINGVFLLGHLAGMKYIISSLLICSLLVQTAKASDTTRFQVDIRRAKLHEDIDLRQTDLMAIDGQKDRQLTLTSDGELNSLLTDIFTRRIDVLQDSLENSATLDHRLKVKYLAGTELMLKVTTAALKARKIEPAQSPLLMRAYEEMVAADINGGSIEPIVARFPYFVGKLLAEEPNTVFYDNRGFANSGLIIFRKFCAAYPSQVLPLMERYHDVPFADSLIIELARQYPNAFYDYAAAEQTRLGQLIRRSSDPLVRAITSLSEKNSGRLLFPFLDEIVSGRISIESIEKEMTDSIRYFRLMVNTQTSYMDRMRMRDTPIAALELPKMMKKKADEVFINQINALHDDPDVIRFKILEPLTSEELYYLIVLGEDIIYTSSYKGVYNRMMERMKSPAGDSLLMSVRFDRFKKFIKMAAGYNRLDHFLSTMPDSNAQRLMIAFARGLDKTGGLEEAVDVADSYGSITTPSVRTLIDREIAASRTRAERTADRRSFVIYNILQTIFSSSSDSTIDVSKQLGIPPVYQVQHASLLDTGGRAVQLVFFYGDKDGKESFANFMGLFTGKPDWTITRTKEWVEIRSVKGVKVHIFANLPLDNTKGDDPDAAAQHHLIEHLEKLGLAPTVVIHRGHSYHLKYTLEQLPSSAKIVILGSCGGFHNLDDVLGISPEAHIISSKEVGTRAVNEPILRAINDDLRNGRDIRWASMWKSLSSQFVTPDAKERFDNYIPPHMNLGALFIKAYQKAMEAE